MSIAPTHQQAAAPAPLPAAEIARQLDGILTGLMRLVGIHVRVLGALTIPLWSRISSARTTLVRLLGHLAAGRLPRPARPRPVYPRPAISRPSRPRVAVLSRRRAWVAHLLDHNVRAHASQLAHLLARPGVAAMIATAPGAARTLRPLCHILGIALPAELRLPPRPPRPPRPARPRPVAPQRPPTPCGPPLQDYVRAAVRAWRRLHPNSD
jgi:hypothetical protein